MRMSATAGGGGDDLAQEEVNAPEFRQVRAPGGGGVIPYTCTDAITVLRKSLKDVAGYKKVGLTKSLRLLVLRLDLCSTLLTVSLDLLC